MGDPVDHSLSPRIHTAALKSLGLAGSYRARRVDADGLDEVLAELRAGSLDGVNVTMPHKEEAAARVDELTQEARRSGSVNTIVTSNGVLTGHTTDVSALRALWRRRDLPTGLPVLVLGSGGAAAAACLAVTGSTTYMAARRIEMVHSLGERLDMDLVPLQWGTAVSDAVVVNTTPIGMHGEALPSRVVEMAAGLIDLPYGPKPTPAVRTASSLKIPVIDGIDFLIAQAADSFRLWTGRPAPMEAMEAAARNPSRDDPKGSNHL